MPPEITITACAIAANASGSDAEHERLDVERRERDGASWPRRS